MAHRSLFFLTILAVVAIGCGGGSTPPSPTPSPGPGPTGTTITITATGATPRELTVSAGARVTFVNNDARPHHMTSDPHPDHLDCPELNDVGLLSPGQSRQTGNLVEVRTCGFHDHDNPDNTSLQGRIIIR